LVLDYGGVLSFDQDPDRIAEMARMFHTSSERFSDVYWQHRRSYDQGLGVEEYWRRVADELGAPLPSLDALIAIDVASWALYREPMWMLLSAFRARGGRSAFLSNNIPELMAFLRLDRQLERSFDVVVASCEVGVDKPEPEIFRICTERLKLEPSACLFVDDRARNVESAARLGWRTMLFEAARAEEQMGELRRLCGLDEAPAGVE
jgi:putative hydrolase of the HAD superfamily